ncbi:MAG: VapC toxin family PIN domain ribonuclease [Cyanobacteria bacterium DS2.3.42]|nr:VapC toxin family PIN domain ribonuclease [Cyanobacteria bacterium DS2.3.42]
MALTVALIDAGPLVAYYNKGDRWHSSAQRFFEIFKGKLITSEPVVTEVMWHLSVDWHVQNAFLDDLQRELFTVASLTPPDFKYIAELNEKYKDLPGDFADLSIVALSERFHLLDVVSLDADFDIYRAYGKKKFVQLFQK